MKFESVLVLTLTGLALVIVILNDAWKRFLIGGRQGSNSGKRGRDLGPSKTNWGVAAFIFASMIVWVIAFENRAWVFSHTPEFILPLVKNALTVPELPK